MLITELLTRPFSYHVPRVAGYSPQISCKIVRVAKSGKNAWRWEALVDKTVMAFGHTETKYIAESKVAGMLEAYTEVHYLCK